MKENFAEIVKFVIPSLLVMATAYYVMKTFMDREIRNAKLELKITNAKIITPIRLQAYERLVLFLERITPDALFVRVYQPGMTTEQLHRALLKTIRSEFEHNLSQQVYVSDEAWEAVKTAKESVLKLINTAASSKKAKENTQNFSQIVIEAYSSVESNPTEAAIEILKTELAEQLM